MPLNRHPKLKGSCPGILKSNFFAPAGRIGGRLFLALLSCAACLYIYEFTQRPNSRTPAHGKVDGKRYTWGHEILTNQFGFRERNFDVLKPEGVYRVMVFGDSLTWGTGLAQDDRFTAVAERNLNQLDFPFRFEVLNFGRSGLPTTKIRDLVRDYITLVGPDRVVISFCLNDVQPRQQEFSVEEEKLRSSLAGRTVAKAERWLRAAGLEKTGSLVPDIFYRVARKLRIIPIWQTALQRTYELDAKEWGDFVLALNDIKVMSDAMGLAPPVFLVLNQGVYLDRITDYANPDEKLRLYLKWYDQAAQAAENAGYVVGSHEREFIDELGPAIMAVNPYDGHPSGEMNRVYGLKLSRIIAAGLGPE